MSGEQEEEEKTGGGEETSKTGGATAENGRRGLDDDDEEDEEDEDIEEMKRKVQEMEEDYKRMQAETAMGGGNASLDHSKHGNGSGAGVSGAASERADDGGEDEIVDDDNSLFVGNLDESVTPEALQDFFKSCGTVNRITIMCDKYTGKPKGFAYMQFEEKEAVELALGLNETEMNGRPIKVSRKRKNVPKFMRGRGRGRGFRGRSRGRGWRGRGGFRGRGRGRFTPY